MAGNLPAVNYAYFLKDRIDFFQWKIQSVDIPLLAYQHSILLSLSLPAQVHALRKQVDMLFMPDALNLVVRMYYSSSMR